MRKNNFDIFIDYLLVFMLIAISGLNYFYLVKEFITVTFILNIIVLSFRKISINRRELTFIIALILLEILQGIIFKKFEIIALFGIFMRLASGYLTIKLVGKSFLKTFIKINIFFAVFSIPIYLLTYSDEITSYFINHITPMFPPLTNINTEQMQIHPNIILYTFNSGSVFDVVRNSGPYYEPGMFSIFLNLALLFNIIINKKFFSINNIILIVTILTTLSTAGYIGLFLVIIGVFFNFNKISSVAILIIVLIIGTYLYNTLPILKEKIENNIESKDRTTSRFGSMYADLSYIKNSPIIGNGRFLFERIGVSIWDVQTRHRNNGISKLMVNYGIPFALYYFYLVFISFKKTIIYYNSRYSAIIALLILLNLGFSQVLFQYAFFLSLPFLYLSYKQCKIHK